MIRTHEEEKKQLDPDNEHQTFYMNKKAFEPTIATIARKGLVSPGSAVERFKSEREARIRGITQAQSIRMEEEARRARDLALAKERAKAEAKARLEKEQEVTIDSQNDGNSLTGSRLHRNVDKGILVSEQDLNTESDLVSVGDEAIFDQEEEALIAVELEKARLASQLETSRLQLEEEERHNLELEEARISSELDAARLKKEKDERLAARLEEVRLASEREAARLQREEEERHDAELKEARNSSELQTARLRKEKEERLSAKLAQARIASENEEARLTREKKERLALKVEQARLEKEERQRIAAEQESIRLQAEENERLRIQAEQQEVARLQAEENERLRIEAEEREAARLQGEENERLSIEAERQGEARLHAEKQRSLRIEAERQESAARLQVEDDAFHGPTPTIAERTSRPGSAALRRRRGQQEEREGQLRGIMHGIATSYSGDDRSVSSVSSFNSMETSLFSHSKNLASGKNLQWEDVSIFVCFGLLTTAEKCPREGIFDPNDTSVNSKILQSVMKKVKKLSRSVIEERSGNMLMKCKQPFVTSVKRDRKCQSVPISLQNVSCSELICIFSFRIF